MTGRHTFEGDLRRLVTTLALSSMTVVGMVGVAVGQEPSPAAAVEARSASSLRFEGAPGTVTRVSGGRYAETVEVRRAPGGDLLIVNDVSMDGYVAGIAEMPTRWPLEALKAQAVAARTYAWFELEQGRWSRFGYDICATTSCQVFRGLEVVETPLTGANWQEAVDATAGEVLVFDGAPILARYFSTSGGRTWDNEVVFPSEGAFPYLKGVEDPDDAASPMHRWELRFTREQFDELLSRGLTVAAASPMASITTVPSGVPGRNESIVVTGQDGSVVEVSPVDFANFVGGVATSLWPDEHPAQRLDGSGRLPTAMPSSRYEFEVTDDEVVILGSGWGHGVGMGQYGALGKAERGLGHVDILRTYYGGLTPTTNEGLPERIRVGLQATRGEIPVRLDGPARLVIGDEVVTERALGTWFVQDGPGGQVSVAPPDGFGEPLALDPTTTSRPTPNEVEIIELRSRVNKPVELRLDVFNLDGQLLSSADLGVHELGVIVVPWSLDDVSRRALPPGTYDVKLVGVDENGVEEGRPVSVSVRPFVVGEGSRSIPPTVWSGKRSSAASLVVPPLPLAASVVLGLLLGRFIGGIAGRRRQRLEDVMVAR